MVTCFARSYESVSTDRQLAGAGTRACVVVVRSEIAGLTGAYQTITAHSLGAAAGTVPGVAVEDAIIA